MRITEEKITKKIPHRKPEEKRPKGGSRGSWIDQIRKDIEMRGEDGKKYNKRWIGRTEVTGDFSVRVEPFFWKRLKKEEAEEYDI